MQSTGQTSTHDLSFTLMHGSAIIYGIEASRLSYALAAGRNSCFCTRSASACQAFGIVAGAARSRNSVGGLRAAHGAVGSQAAIASGGAGRERRAVSRRRG